jgi:hypothetical protein
MSNFFGTIDRRWFCCAIALGFNVIQAKSPLGSKHESTIAADDLGFMIVNGWVLLREDMAGSGMTHHAVRLQ